MSSTPSITQKVNGHPNFTRVVAGGIAYWFSYETCVGFSYNGRRAVRKNVWGPTTGKHLNYIDDGEKGARLELDEFQDALLTAQRQASEELV